MPLLKTQITEEFVELVIGTPEDEESALGEIDGVDAEEDHAYIKVKVDSSEGDRLGDVQLQALKAARNLIGEEISRITALQQSL